MGEVTESGPMARSIGVWNRSKYWLQFFITFFRLDLAIGREKTTSLCVVFDLAVKLGRTCPCANLESLGARH